MVNHIDHHIIQEIVILHSHESLMPCYWNINQLVNKYITCMFEYYNIGLVGLSVFSSLIDNIFSTQVVKFYSINYH